MQTISTDICNDVDLPEVEILSLIEEQIPRYRLRIDTITEFQGYENSDWIQTPVLPPVDDADLTPELVEETLKYFILCADRVTSMTKTYNDIGAVTRLLEEKERDLELAARIGQTLLEKNKGLEEKNERLEELIAQANEKLNQLKHELSMKDELLKIFTQNYDGQECYSPDGPRGIDSLSPDVKKKVQSLEDENLQLKLETNKLKSVTDILEEKEQKLVNDCVQQLEELHQQLEVFSTELSEKTDECCHQKEEITHLLHQIVNLQKRIRTLTAENLDFQKTLDAAHDTENYLTREIAELKEKNEEILVLLDDAQDEVRRLRNKDRPNAVRHNYMSSSHCSMRGDSLAAELESSLRSELEYPKGYSPMERNKHNWKIFETAKAAKSAGHQSSLSHSRTGSCVSAGPAGSSTNLSVLGASMIESGVDTRSVSNRSSMYLSDGEACSVVEGASNNGELDSLYGATRALGRPGIPGSNDLQTALRRLSMRRANELNENDYAREEQERQNRDRTLSERSDTESSYTPGRCHTPESMFSANSGYLSMTGSCGNSSNPYFRMPEKLRIVKPLEGSVTLRQWQQLATPNLGGIFESRPGVQIKGEAKLDVEETEVYTLSDYEEDDESQAYPSRFQESSGVYTLTNSTVRHPSQADRMSSSFSTSTPRMASSVPRTEDTRGTSTYSMSLGLASILNERDLTTTQPEGATYTTQSSMMGNPSRFPSLISDTHFNPTANVSSADAASTLATSSYNLISSSSTYSQRSNQGQRSEQGLSSINEQRSQLSIGAIGKDRTQSTHSSDRQQGAQSSQIFDKTGSMSPNSQTNSLEMINKLKNTGFSLFGYLTGQSGGQEVSATIDQSRTSVSTVTSNIGRPGYLPLTSSVNSRSNTTLTSTSTTSVTMTTSATDLDNLVSIGTTQDESGKRSKLGSLLSRHTAGSVIGALAKYHRDSSL